MEEKAYYSKLREAFRNEEYFFHDIDRFFDDLECLAEEQKQILEVLYEVMNLELDESGQGFITYQGEKYNTVLKKNSNKYSRILLTINQEKITECVKARINDILFLITNDDRFLELSIDAYMYAFTLYKTGKAQGRVIYNPLNRAIFLSEIAKRKGLPIADRFLSCTWGFIEEYSSNDIAIYILEKILDKKNLGLADKCLDFLEKDFFSKQIADSNTHIEVKILNKYRHINKTKIMRHAAEITEAEALANDYIPERDHLLEKAIEYAIDSVGKNMNVDEDDYVVKLCKLKEESNMALLDSIGCVSVPYEKEYLEAINSIIEKLKSKNCREMIESILDSFYVVKKTEVEDKIKNSTSLMDMLFPVCIITEDIPFRKTIDGISCNKDQENRIIFEFGQSLKLWEPYYLQIYDLISSRLEEEGDFYWIFKDNPIVPLDRQERLAKAFSVAFTIDFGIGVNSILPEVENVFRFLVNEAGGLIYSPSKKKLHSLGALLSSKWIVEMIDGDYLFNFKSLMIESYAANIRNYRLHGNYSGKYPSVYEIYLLLLLLKWFYSAVRR